MGGRTPFGEDIFIPWAVIDEATLPRRPQADLHATIDVDPQVATRTMDLGRIYWKGRQWVVNDYGIVSHIGNGYALEHRELQVMQQHDFDRMMNKIWIDFEDFMTALYVSSGCGAPGGFKISGAVRRAVSEFRSLRRRLFKGR